MRFSTLLMTASMLAAVAGSPAWAGKADGIARIALPGEVGTLNYYFDSSREGYISSLQIFDGLLYQDPKSGEFKPNLAESWKWVDDTTLELKLRQNVKFSNGEAFDADDVVFTVGYITNPANKIVVYDKVKWMKSAEKVDAHTVKLHLHAPYPLALNVLGASMPMYPKDYYEKVGASEMAVKPVGTGPYRVVSVSPGAGFTLEKNPNYFGGPKGSPTISKVEVRTIRDVNTQLAELMSGNLDFMWQFPADIATKLGGTGQFNVTQKPTMRIGFVTLDAMNRSNPKSPLADVRVRQAINYAVDRKGIVAGLVGEGSQVIPSACSPVQFGCEQNVATYAYDPAKAKQLLAAAGFPNGFTIEMGAYRDRPQAEAMINNLAAVGIKVNLSMLQYSALASRHMEGNVPMAFLTHGSSSISDVAAITPEFFGLGKQDYAGDKEVADLLKEGGSTIDEAKRKAAYSKAFKIIAEKAYWLPLWTYPSTYAMSKELKFDPTADELLRFYDMSWN